METLPRGFSKNSISKNSQKKNYFLLKIANKLFEEVHLRSHAHTMGRDNNGVQVNEKLKYFVVCAHFEKSLCMHGLAVASLVLVSKFAEIDLCITF